MTVSARALSSPSPERTIESANELTFLLFASTALRVGMLPTLIGFPSASTGATALFGAGVALSGDELENENAWVAA